MLCRHLCTGSLQEAKNWHDVTLRLKHSFCSLRFPCLPAELPKAMRRIRIAESLWCRKQKLSCTALCAGEAMQMWQQQQLSQTSRRLARPFRAREAWILSLQPCRCLAPSQPCSPLLFAFPPVCSKHILSNEGSCLHREGHSSMHA